MRKDMDKAERTFAAVVRSSPDEALNQWLPVVQDCLDVHRVVLPWRSWALLDIVGAEHAQTLLRQSVHFCVQNEAEKYRNRYSGARAALTKLFDQHKLAGKTPGKREADDATLAKLADTIFGSKPDEAAGAAAQALADGYSVAVLGEALAVAANQLVLRDAGRPAGQTNPKKPLGSVHGDSIGVHACDSANAWRHLAAVSNPRNAFACLILGAYQVANDRGERGGDFMNWKPRPWDEHTAALMGKDPAAVMKEADGAIRSNDQAKACAAVARLAELKQEARPVIDMLLRYAVSEDGALHAEKYYRTTTEEFAATRPALRWRQLVALARVTASEYGQPAPGYAEACKLLKV
jgi:hypothetical protein